MAIPSMHTEGESLYHDNTYYWYGEIKNGKTWLVPGPGLGVLSRTSGWYFLLFIERPGALEI